MDLSKYTGIFYDSREVIPAGIFVAIRGEKHDGHVYVSKAIELGATLIVVAEDFDDSSFKHLAIKFLKVKNTRKELASLSYEFYAKAIDKLTNIAVTGTNGKTSITHIIQSILSKQNLNCAVLGTMGLKLSPEATYQDLGNTTPQSTEVHKIADDLVTNTSTKYLAMEVSSHALEQYRVGSVSYKTSIVTNLTQDHLDYHITMENYFQAKAKLFEQSTDFAILNLDDSYYQRFKEKAEEQKLTVIAFSADEKHKEQADLFANDIKLSHSGLSYKIKLNSKFKDKFPKLKAEKFEQDIVLNLGGMFNVHNSLAAIAACLLEEVSLAAIASSLAEVETVAGRFEIIKKDNAPLCVVDYAHSPDGLDNVLKGARLLVKEGASLLCVFGCGGDRDVTKRPQMGKIAFDLSDKVYVTSDNPRTEDPEKIIADILRGMPNTTGVEIIADRALAIKQALENAQPQDVIVIAGKGHEDYQILGDKKIHFDDREEVKKALQLI